MKMEYKRNGELKEVTEVALNKEPGQEAGQLGTIEMCLPKLVVKKKVQKYRKPKVQPKVSVYVLGTMNNEYIRY